MDNCEQMQLPPAIADALAAQFGAIAETTPVSGGMINQSVRVRAAFAKWRRDLRFVGARF